MKGAKHHLTGHFVCIAQNRYTVETGNVPSHSRKYVYTLELLSPYRIALCEALRTCMDLRHTVTILTD